MWALPSLHRVDALIASSFIAADEQKKGEEKCYDMRPPDVQWSGACNRFVFVVDCQPVQKIVCGHAPLLASDCEPLFHRILNNIAHIIMSGTLPPNNHSDPVCWTKRDRNQLADYICNVTMDSCSCWREVRQVGVPDNANVLVCSDGGSREDCSAIGWVLGYIGQAEKFIPFIIEGVFLLSPISSFLEEAMAIENATSELKHFLHGRLSK